MDLLIRSVLPGQQLDSAQVERLRSETTPEALLPLAAYHGVSGMAYEALRPMLPQTDPLLGQLKARYERAVIGHMRVAHGLIRVREAMTLAECKWAVIKGPVIVEMLYDGVPGRRAYGDLDLLVHPAGFADALDALGAMGAILHDRNWAVLRRDMRGEVHLSLPSGVPLDLHWNLINMYRGRMRIDTAEVVARAVDVENDGIAIPSLGPEDAILHLALHAALSGGDRLLWLKDIERGVEVWRPDWNLILERARRWRVGPPVGLMLGRSHDVLGAKIPDGVPDQLIGAGRRRVARWVDWVSPWQFGMGRLAAPTRLIARSIGKGPIGAPAWILWRGLRNLDRGQERRSLAFTPSGDDRDRRAFIEAIVAIGRESNA